MNLWRATIATVVGVVPLAAWAQSPIAFGSHSTPTLGMSLSFARDESLDLLFSESAKNKYIDRWVARNDNDSAAAFEAQVGDAEPTASQVRFRTRAFLGLGALSVALYGKSQWWKDGFEGRFRTVNEGWFGQSTPYGGTDKLGHFYSNYVGTRLMAVALKALGNNAEDARRLGFWTTLGTFTAVEVLDGFSKKWRFSKEDAIMNATGAALGYFLETRPNLDDLLDVRLLYQPSSEARESGEVNAFGDYSGQRYLMVLKASGIPALKEKRALRYLEFAVGYGARGYEPDIGGERTRNLYYGVSLNISQILADSLFRGNSQPTRTQHAVDTVLEFVQIPGIGAYARYELGSAPGRGVSK